MATKKNRHLFELRQLIDDESTKSDVQGIQRDQNECEKVPTPRDRKSNVEVVVFESHKKKLKKEKLPVFDANDKRNVETKKLNFHKTRFEVQNFGINGFAKDDKEKAKIAIAVKLGAKPPHNKFINYKKLMEMKKIEQSQHEAVDDHHSLLTLRAKKRSSKINKNKVRGFDEAFGKVKKPNNRKFSFKNKMRK